MPDHPERTVAQESPAPWGSLPNGCDARGFPCFKLLAVKESLMRKVLYILGVLQEIGRAHV